MTFLISELNVLLLISQDIVRGLRNESAREQRKEEVKKSKITLREKKSQKRIILKSKRTLKEEIKNICGRKNR
jgi:hypothetical protein